MLNREAWLTQLAGNLRHYFRENGYRIRGEIVVSSAALRTSVLGVCKLNGYNDETRKTHIFITAYDNSHPTDVDAASTLVHEILHAVLPPDAGHKAPFKKGMAALGLVGKATEADAGPELRKYLAELLKHMPPMPRNNLTAPRKPESDPKDPKGKSRFQCDDCKLTVELTYTALKIGGKPDCWNQECDCYRLEMTEK